MSDLPMRSLAELPLILAGPMLRRTTPAAVTVWVALKSACEVTLQVLETLDSGKLIGSQLCSGRQATISLGQNLHVIAVTATAARGLELTPDRVYAYDLTFSPVDRQTPDLTLHQAISVPNLPPPRIGYFAHQYPTFVLPPDRIEDLRIVHGSCRKPHGNGFDALTILDRLLATFAGQPSQRPQQLFLSGDQIYGDDVADPLLWLVSHLSSLLLGWTERLPISESEERLATELTFGNRAKIARQAGFTAGLPDRQYKVQSHLLSLGEYAAVYLLTWSPVCWPQLFPSGISITTDRRMAKNWDRQVRYLERFIAGLGDVRRALANIPLYTIFDDHEVSDDWNLNQAWCLRVLSQKSGNHVVQNALLAYAIFQGWGNTPDRFEVGTSGGQLLAAAQIWSQSGGTDTAAHADIARLVGMPQRELVTGLPKFVSDGDVSILDRDPAAIAWNYTISSGCHEVIVLDTRTWRGYDLSRSIIDPPMLLSPTAFDRQLIQPLQASGGMGDNFVNTNCSTSDSHSANLRQTFIVAPTNLFSLTIIDWIHYLSLKDNLNQPTQSERGFAPIDRAVSDGVFAADVGDAWNINTAALARLLTTLFAHRDTIVVLSGDIHYGSVGRLSYDRLDRGSLPSILVQLTASALKNEEPKTKLLHTRLKDWLLPEQIRRSIGWNRPPQMLPFRSRVSSDDGSPRPDWKCTLHWIPRNPSTPAGFGLGRLRSIASFGSQSSAAASTFGSFHLIHLGQRLKWWNSRWIQDGREVVGLNNLAVVQWQSRSIVQDLYWISPWLPTQIVFSRFVASLESNDE
jgi:hypothetical protein